MAFLLVEKPDLDVVEAALKAQQGFRGDIAQKIVAPVSDVVSDQVAFIVLFDPIALDGIIQEVRKV